MERIPDAHAADPIEVIWEDEWQKNVLEAAIENVKRTVDAKQFQMFDCYALKGWPVNDVAKNLNATVGQIYTAKSRVAALIREEVERLEKKMV
jgi:RNA polymerase sigma-70 factor (ECF subfamily)